MQISISNIVKGTVIGSAFTAISRYFTRVTQAGAIYEKPLCVESGINSSPLLQQASMLILPSGYKGGTAYAELPSNGNGDLTWTRASDAWRTNADGLIQRVPWNLFLYSEDLSNASNWFTIAATVSTNTTTAPNGTLTADKLTATATTSTHLILQQPAGSVNGTTSTVSIYAKDAGLSRIQILNNAGGSGVANYNLSTGTATLLSGVSASIESVGNGWFRCIMTYTPTTTGTYNIQIRLADNSGNTTFLGNATDGVFLWGAQLVEGSSAQTYFPTTDRLNVPRLSYMYGSCPALLLEPQRTNLALRSEEFDNATIWQRTSGVTTTANQATAPDGTNTMDLITFPSSGTSINQANTVTNGATYTFSVWLATQSGTQTVEIGNINSGVYQTVTVTTTPQRFEVTQAASSATRYPAIRSTGAYSIFAWGAQLEAGAYPTTYIPTTTASATRIADSFSRNNIYTNGLITSSGGTWFVELRGNVPYTRDASGSFFIDSQNGGLGNGFNIRNVGTPNQRFVIVKYVSFASSNLYFTLTDTVKIAIKWNGTTADVFVNGTKQVSGTSFTTTNMDFFGANGNDQPKFIQQMALYPSALSDTDCTTLTTL